MKKLKKSNLIKSAPILFLLIFSVSSCDSYVNVPITPPLLSFSTYAYGQGTDYYNGAVSFEIDPLSSYYYYAYFEIQISGLGTYDLTGNKLFIPYLLPGNYPFTINISCDNYNSSCPARSLYGSFNIYESTTTQVLAQP